MIFGRLDVPLDEDSSSRFLPWLIAFMVFLAAIALACVLLTEGLIQRWDRGLRAEVTVQVPAPDVEEAQRGARLQSVLSILRNTAGVTEATALSQQTVAGLVEPWLGDQLLRSELPLPDLVSVIIDPDVPPDLDVLQERLEAAVPGTAVDDHQRWLQSLISVARSVELGALVILGLIVVACIGTTIFATRASLSIHWQVIELLHLMGAEDRYVARQFQGHALRLGLRGGILGFVFAVGILALIGFLGSGGQVAMLPRIELRLIDWAILLVIPVTTALIATVTAQITVMRTLGRMS